MRGGGASLKADSFVAMVKRRNELSVAKLLTSVRRLAHPVKFLLFATWHVIPKGSGVCYSFVRKNY